jgi:hypothetical protein
MPDPITFCLSCHHFFRLRIAVFPLAYLTIGQRPSCQNHTIQLAQLNKKLFSLIDDELVAVRAADSEVYLFSLSRIMKR